MGKHENMDSTIVNSITLGKLLGISSRRVAQLVDEGVFESVSRGKYELYSCVPKYCNYIRQKSEADSSKTGAKIDKEIEQALHEKIKREKAELQLKLMKSELHRSEDVEKLMTDMITKAKTRLLGIPSKAAPMVIGYTDIPMIQNIIQKLVDEALLELADYDPESFSNDSILQGGDDNDEY